MDGYDQSSIFIAN